MCNKYTDSSHLIVGKKLLIKGMAVFITCLDG